MSLRHSTEFGSSPNLRSGSDEKRRTADARDVKRVWASRIDLARIKRTFSDGDISFSDTIEVEPDKVFSCGTIVKHRGQTWRIRALHSGTGRTLSGKMIARDIRRIFLHRPPSPEEIAEKRIIERGNWKVKTSLVEKNTNRNGVVEEMTERHDRVPAGAYCGAQKRMDFREELLDAAQELRDGIYRAEALCGLCGSSEMIDEDENDWIPIIVDSMLEEEQKLAIGGKHWNRCEIHFQVAQGVQGVQSLSI